jgi:Co/Zn/Cd efflux system component
MSDFKNAAIGAGHHRIFVGAGHERNERKTWAVIALCSAMMLIEIVGGSVFGSLALVAEGLRMSTHAGAILIAALAYTYAREHATESRFVFGTGKLGDLAGFTSAIVLAMIAVLIGYEAVSRFLSPVPIHFGEAIPIAVVGLLVNLASVWLLSGGDHGLVTVIATDMAIVTTTMLMKTRCRRFSPRPVHLPFPSSRMGCRPSSALHWKRRVRDWTPRRCPLRRYDPMGRNRYAHCLCHRSVPPVFRRIPTAASCTRLLMSARVNSEAFRSVEWSACRAGKSVPRPSRKSGPTTRIEGAPPGRSPLFTSSFGTLRSQPLCNEQIDYVHQQVYRSRLAKESSPAAWFIRWLWHCGQHDDRYPGEGRLTFETAA